MTLEKTDYNGWTNRQTWNVALWLGNDARMYASMIERIKFFQGMGCDVGPNRARMIASDILGSRTPDNCSLRGVNWSEIADMMRESVS